MSRQHSIGMAAPGHSAGRAAQNLASVEAPQQVDGKRAAFFVAPVAAPATQTISDKPILPDPMGDSAEAEAVFRCVNRVNDDGATSMFAVLQTMTEMRQSGMTLAQLMKIMRTKRSMDSKQRELDRKREEIAANNESTTGKLVASLVATGLTATAAYFLRYQDLGINQAATGGFDYWDRNYGGLSRANVASQEQKHEQNVAQQEQTQVDAASAYYEQVKEARKNAQQTIMAHVQMVGDATNNVWR